MKKKNRRSVTDAIVKESEERIRAKILDPSQFGRCYAVNRPVPATHILSNGRYTVMVTAAGAGFSRIHDLAVTRWREDVTRDSFGFFSIHKGLSKQQCLVSGVSTDML